MAEIMNVRGLARQITFQGDLPFDGKRMHIATGTRYVSDSDYVDIMIREIVVDIVNGNLLCFSLTLQQVGGERFQSDVYTYCGNYAIQWEKLEV